MASQETVATTIRPAIRNLAGFCFLRCTVVVYRGTVSEVKMSINTGVLTVRGMERDGEFYGATDGVLRWNFTVMAGAGF